MQSSIVANIEGQARKVFYNPKDGKPQFVTISYFDKPLSELKEQARLIPNLRLMEWFLLEHLKFKTYRLHYQNQNYAYGVFETNEKIEGAGSLNRDVN
jgi:hypothetical protein